MAVILPLYSGSTGNCTFVGNKTGGILIDAGASCKGIAQGLSDCGIDLGEIKAIAVTHTHIDHIKGLKTLLKRTGVPIIATEKTLSCLAAKDMLPPKAELLPTGDKIHIAGLEIASFATSHDAEGSCGYTVELADGKRFSLCTDTGVITEEIRSAIAKSDAVLIESNHDIEMLKRGPYPPLTKVRIMSEKGHISNAACAGEVARLFKSGTTRFILGHLSLNNNTVDLAKSTSEAALMDLGAKNGIDYILKVAKPSCNGATVL